MTGRDRFTGEFEQVLAGAHRDETWALERVYKALAPLVAGYLRVQGSREPDDMTSEVFVGVLRGIAKFRGNESQFRSWVFTIAHRRLLDERRQAAKRPTPKPLSEEVDPIAPDNVQAEVGNLLTTEQIADLCQRLAPDQRDVLLLRLLGRMSVVEVADALGKKPGAVRSLQHRGVAAIERLIGREGVIL